MTALDFGRFFVRSTPTMDRNFQSSGHVMKPCRNLVERERQASSLFRSGRLEGVHSCTSSSFPVCLGTASSDGLCPSRTQRNTCEVKAIASIRSTLMDAQAARPTPTQFHERCRGCLVQASSYCSSATRKE